MLTYLLLIKLVLEKFIYLTACLSFYPSTDTPSHPSIHLSIYINGIPDRWTLSLVYSLMKTPHPWSEIGSPNSLWKKTHRRTSLVEHWWSYAMRAEHFSPPSRRNKNRTSVTGQWLSFLCVVRAEGLQDVFQQLRSEVPREWDTAEYNRH
jgi:hypothetical protein